MMTDANVVCNPAIGMDVVEATQRAHLAVIFAKADQPKPSNRLDKQAYLWAFDEARRTDHSLIRAPMAAIEREFTDRATLAGIALSDFVEAVLALKSPRTGATATTEILQQAESPVTSAERSLNPPTSLLDGPPAVEEHDDHTDSDGGDADNADAHGEHMMGTDSNDGEHVAGADYRDVDHVAVNTAGDDYRAVAGGSISGDEVSTQDNNGGKKVKRVRIQVTQDTTNSRAVRADGEDDVSDVHVPEDRPVGQGLRASKLSKGPLSTGASMVSSIASSGRKIRDKIGHWFGVMPDDYDGSPPAEYHYAAPGTAINSGGESGGSGGSGGSSGSGESSGDADAPERRAPMSPARAKLESIGLEVIDMFDPATEEVMGLPKSLYGEVLGEDGEAPLITDYHAALTAYRRYIAKEKVFKRKRMHRQLTDDSDHTRSTDTSRTNQTAPKRKGALNDDVKMQLRSLPTFAPRFIPAVTFVQLVVICAMLFDSYTSKEFARIGLSSTQHQCSVQQDSPPTCPLNFRGLQDMDAVQTESANMWIGPDARYLIQFGAKFAPCMRRDLQLLAKSSRVRHTECGTTVEQCDDPTVTGGEGYSCCGYEARSFGMTNLGKCNESGGVWLNDRGRHRQCNDQLETIYLRPCCVGNLGECRLYTETQCEFYKGVFHLDKQLCSEVSCLSGTCSSIWGDGGPAPDDNAPNDLAQPDQWWRFIWPIFMHAGVIHFVLCMMIQWIVGCQIERTAGWLRVLLIYFVSGIGGYVVSGMFDPLNVAVGSDPAVFGLLAVLYVELFQSWRVVPNPRTELCKLTAVFGVASVAGTLPFVDNWSHLGGFVFGVLASIIFLPYITFGRWDYHRKRCLLWVSGPALLTLAITMLITFYLVQDAECEWCSAISCVAYTSDIECN